MASSEYMNENYDKALLNTFDVIDKFLCTKEGLDTL